MVGTVGGKYLDLGLLNPHLPRRIFENCRSLDGCFIPRSKPFECRFSDDEDFDGSLKFEGGLDALPTTAFLRQCTSVKVVGGL